MDWFNTFEETYTESNTSSYMTYDSEVTSDKQVTGVKRGKKSRDPNRDMFALHMIG